MSCVFNTFSEIGPLRTVMLHRPGDELLNLSPDSLDRLLFDDIPFLEGAQREHDTFARMLAEEGVEVLYLDQLVAEAIDAAPDGRELFVDRYVAECGLEGCDALQGLVHDVLLYMNGARGALQLNRAVAVFAHRALRAILGGNGRAAVRTFDRDMCRHFKISFII